MLLSKSRSILLALFVSFSFPAIADEKIVELFTVQYSPYTIIDQQNNITGIDVEVTQAAFAAVGIDAKISLAPWKRIIKNTKHGRIAGLLSCSKRDDRTSYITYSDQLSEINQVAVMAANATSRKLKNFADLNRFHVTAVEGWGVERELTSSNIKHTMTPDINSGIRSVVFRDIDVFYNGELASLYHARQLNLHDKIKTLRFADKESTSLHLCLSKKHPDSDRLVKLFNIGLNTIKESGEFDAIYKKYL